MYKGVYQVRGRTSDVCRGPRMAMTVTRQNIRREEGWRFGSWMWRIYPFQNFGGFWPVAVGNDSISVPDIR